MTYSRDQFIDLLYKCVLYYADAWNRTQDWKGRIDPLPDKNVYWLLCQDDAFLREQTVVILLYMRNWNWVEEKPSLKWDFKRNVPAVLRRLSDYKRYMNAPWDFLTYQFGYASQNIVDPGSRTGTAVVHILSTIDPSIEVPVIPDFKI